MVRIVSQYTCIVAGGGLLQSIPHAGIRDALYLESVVEKWDVGTSPLIRLFIWSEPSFEYSRELRSATMLVR